MVVLVWRGGFLVLHGVDSELHERPMSIFSATYSQGPRTTAQILEAAAFAQTGRPQTRAAWLPT